MIIYPPYIEGTIPAFTSGVLKVPFSMNPGVGYNEPKQMIAKISELNSADVIGYSTKDITTTDLIASSEVIFNTIICNEGKSLIAGNYYKIQLAYSDKSQDNIQLTYSTTAIARYLGEKGPTIELESIDPLTYKGIYTDGTVAETEYSYEFNVYDKNNNLIMNTGKQLHVTNTDDYLYINKTLEYNQSYKIEYNVITINGYQLQITKSLTPIPYDVTGVNSFTLSLNDDNSNNNNVTINIIPANTGMFSLQRASSKDNYNTWEEIITFVTNTTDKAFVWEDNTVEHGLTYKYGLVQYNSNNVHKNRNVCSQTIETFYEDLFLSDADRQLCIKFNPEVSSMKETILESKMDTIGSKYPFFFRNGNVRYREIPISGLISYQLDKAEKFIGKDKLGLYQESFDKTRPMTSSTNINNRISTTNLVDYNIYAERIFREEVLKWLNNGKMKLFRSPTEGNFVVRLMNVSLSPQKTLSRMLYSFSCTAYEITDTDYSEMRAAGVVDTMPIAITDGVIEYNTIAMKDKYTEISGSKEEYYTVISGNIINAEFKNFMPGDIIKYDDTEIMIGATGSYVATIPAAAISIKREGFKGYTGTINYQSIAETAITDFDNITKYQDEGIYAITVMGNNSPDVDVITTLNEQLADYITIQVSFSFRLDEEFAAGGTTTSIIIDGNTIDLYYTIGKTYFIDCGQYGQIDECTIGSDVEVDVVLHLIKKEVKSSG